MNSIVTSTYKYNPIITPQPIWELLTMNGKQAAHTGQFDNAFHQDNLTNEEAIVREAAQNAVDAGRNVKGPTRIKFHELEISGNSKTKLLDMLAMNDVFTPGRINAIKKQQDPRSQKFAADLIALKNSDKIKALLISDYNTCGLGGSLVYNDDPNNHFYRIVMSTGLDDKGNNGNTGGSFGWGKTVFARNSLARLVLYHSVFKPTKTTNGTHRRLMTTGIFPKHQFKETYHGGYSYFGSPCPNGNGAVPFVDPQAEHLWNEMTKLFGIKHKRLKKDHGTDVLVLMTELEFSKLIDAGGKYFWPAIVNGDLIMEFEDAAGKNTIVNPNSRPELKEFIGMEQYTKPPTFTTNTSSLISKKLKSRKQFGHLVLKRLDSIENLDKKDIPVETDCIALSRGSGMIIDYKKYSNHSDEIIVGYFEAHPDIQTILQRSENTSHSAWHHNSQRLSTNEKKLVKTLNDRLESEFRKFQALGQQRPEIKKSDAGLLGQLLSQTLAPNTKKHNGRPPKTFNNPISISLTNISRNKNKSVWEIKLDDNNHTPNQPFELTIRPSVFQLGIEKKVKIQNVKINAVHGSTSKHETYPVFPFTYQKNTNGTSLTVTHSNPKNKDFKIRCECEVAGEIGIKQTSENESTQ